MNSAEVMLVINAAVKVVTEMGEHMYVRHCRICEDGETAINVDADTGVPPAIWSSYLNSEYEWINYELVRGENDCIQTAASALVNNAECGVELIVETFNADMSIDDFWKKVELLRVFGQ